MAHIWANQPARSDLRSGHRARAHPPVIDTSSVIEVCPGGAPEARNNAEGFTRIELRGDKLSRALTLTPIPAETLVAPVLEKWGLGSPLTLQD